MDKSEVESGNENIVKIDKLNRSITVLKPNAPLSEPPKVYYFDNVFAEDSAQVCIFLWYIFESNCLAETQTEASMNFNLV